MKSRAPFTRHQIEEHLIRSQAIAQTFRVKVLQPMSRSDRSERFPVLYTTDSDYFFGGLSNLANMMQGYGEIPRVILVGIGYADSGAAPLLRLRDLLSRPVQELLATLIKQTADSEFVTVPEDVQHIASSTDAAEFLRFVHEELMPFIDAHYPTLPDDRSFFGYSAGGTFGLYTLFTRPDTFRRYVLGSPATSYDGHHFGIELAERFVRSGRSIDAKVFMSVGELEELQSGTDRFDLVSGYYLLARFLQRSPVAGLDLTLRVFPGETHATAWTMSFSHGLKALFGPADRVPFWPELSSDH